GGRDGIHEAQGDDRQAGELIEHDKVLAKHVAAKHDASMARGDVREGKMNDVLMEGLDDGVLTLTMNRPDRLNALNPEMLARLHDALERAAADCEVAVIVLAGAGRAFCAGGDVKAMAEGRSESFDERARGLRQRMEAARLLHEIPKPTIAMLRGAAAGAGLSLALAC